MLVTRPIEYTADDLGLVGHLAYDDSVEGRRPAVLVAHEGPGLDVHAKDVADQLAALGFVAFALDYMGEGRPAPADQMMGRLGSLMGDVSRIRALGQAGLAIRGIVLVCIGTEDPIIPPEQRTAFEAEMRAGEVDWRMHLHGGAAHSFTNPHASDLGMPGIAFHRSSDERSWRAMLDCFTEAVGLP
jgi:dienelactone hydrolase